MMSADPSTNEPVLCAIDGGIARLTLNDPARRNAMGVAMFEALERRVHAIASDSSARVVLLTGAGHAFCAGFDLGAAVEQPALMAHFIQRLSDINRSIRRLPQVVVAAVQGAAIAGGCAILSACDFVVVCPDATLGYPVHRIGVSPAVTLPLLRLGMGDGPARALALSGELIDGQTAFQRRLATHLAPGAGAVIETAERLCAELLRKGPRALKATKAWLNELDGSLRDDAFDGARDASASLTSGDEANRMLSAFWSARRKRDG